MNTQEQTMDALTKRIYEDADKKLKARIDGAISGIFMSLLNEFGSMAQKHVGDISFGTISGKNIWPNDARRVAEDSIFEGFKQANRQRVLGEFVDRFNKLDTELDEIRGYVDQARQQ